MTAMPIANRHPIVPSQVMVRGDSQRWRRNAPLLLSVLLAIACKQGYAQKPPDVTAGEVARLPAYCADSQSFADGGFPEGPLPNQKPWIAKMGHGFWAVHHYCWAMINVNRAMASVVQQTRQYLLSRAIDDCKYVVAHAGSDFVLLPEIYLRMGEYYGRLGQPVAALLHFERSKQTKPDYWPAYLHMAELQAKLGKRAAAVDALSEGLKQVPQQPQLLAAMARLGGKPAGKGMARSSGAASGAGPGAK